MRRATPSWKTLCVSCKIYVLTQLWCVQAHADAHRAALRGSTTAMHPFSQVPTRKRPRPTGDRPLDPRRLSRHTPPSSTTSPTPRDHRTAINPPCLMHHPLRTIDIYDTEQRR
ncbi:hypothetical protein C8Q80DRAFT_361409 [Daedaleopsis nitida]|nr:hypothetical protein C8Q80DRAFT_361409 [Daedaleopsis nitida]